MSELTDALKEYREQLTKAETNIKLLRSALCDMMCIAEVDKWDKATTGRQIIFQTAEDVMYRTRPKEYETLTEIPEDVMEREFKS